MKRFLNIRMIAAGLLLFFAAAGAQAQDDFAVQYQPIRGTSGCDIETGLIPGSVFLGAGLVEENDSGCCTMPGGCGPCEAEVRVEYDETADITTYTAKLPASMTFADGAAATADDVIFTDYILLDPAYSGPAKQAAHDIVGLRDYQNQTTAEIYEKYAAEAQAIYEANWEYPEGIPEEHTSYYLLQYDYAWIDLCKTLARESAEKDADEKAADFGLNADEVKSNEGLSIAFAMALRGFGTIEDGIFTNAADTYSYDLNAGDHPTYLDFQDASSYAYNGDGKAFFAAEYPESDAQDPAEIAAEALIAYYGIPETRAAGGVRNISGIEKIDDSTIVIRINGKDLEAADDLFKLQVIPLQKYGDVSLYRYELNSFGHPFGDLSGITSKLVPAI